MNFLSFLSNNCLIRLSLSSNKNYRCRCLLNPKYPTCFSELKTAENAEWTRMNTLVNHLAVKFS